MAKQILWNPIDGNMFAICSDDGSLTVCLFHDKDHYGTKTIVKTEVRYVVAIPHFKYYWVAQIHEIFAFGLLDAFVGARKEIRFSMPCRMVS